MNTFFRFFSFSFFFLFLVHKLKLNGCIYIYIIIMMHIIIMLLAVTFTCCNLDESGILESLCFRMLVGPSCELFMQKREVIHLHAE